MAFQLDYDLNNAPSYSKITAVLPRVATAQGSLSISRTQDVPEKAFRSATTSSEHYQPPNHTHHQASSSSFFPNATGPEYNARHATRGEALIDPWAGVITGPCTFIVPFHPAAPSIQGPTTFSAIISGPSTFSLPLRPPPPPSYSAQLPLAPYEDPFTESWLEDAAESTSNPSTAWNCVQYPQPPMFGDSLDVLNDNQESNTLGPELSPDKDSELGVLPTRPLYKGYLPSMQELRDEGYPEVWKSDDGAHLVPIDLGHFDEFCMSLIDGSFFAAEGQAQEDTQNYPLN
ncbi:hypothetical protein MD484_g2213, partial [Candolleomyces efflorescens]